MRERGNEGEREREIDRERERGRQRAGVKPYILMDSVRISATATEVWEAVIKDRSYKKHDWLVKADLDSVFFPGRLRDRPQRSREMTADPHGVTPCGGEVLHVSAIKDCTQTRCNQAQAARTSFARRR